MKHAEKLQVIFDGHCKLCQASIAHLLNRFEDRLLPVDFRSRPPEEIHSDLTEARAHARMHVIQGGKLYGGAEAMVKIYDLHPFLRYVVGLYYLPPLGWLAERGYDLVARNRFRLSKFFKGDESVCTNACSIIPPPNRGRGSSDSDDL